MAWGVQEPRSTNLQREYGNGRDRVSGACGGWTWRVLKTNSKVLMEPSPNVEVIALTDIAVKLSIRPWAKNENFSKVCSETLENCKTELQLAGISIKS